MTQVWAIYDWLRLLDPRIWQALIAGAFLAIGWVYNGWRNRVDGRRLRAEKLRDAHRALFAEIETFLVALESEETLDKYSEGLIDKMRADQRFVPFIPKERNDRVYSAIQSEINVLPRVTIDPVVMYYSLLDAISALAEDMRGETYKSLSQERRIAIYRDYIAMRKQALTYGRRANHLISVYAKDGKLAAENTAAALKAAAKAEIEKLEEARVAELNSQNAGPSAT